MGIPCQLVTATAMTENSILLLRLRCKSWDCPDCGPYKLQLLRARALAGDPNVFLTLTVRPQPDITPDYAALKLLDAWRALYRRIKREHPHYDCSYLYVFERTKAGWPHLHILARLPYIPQREISEHMDRRLRSPVVWIEFLKDKHRAVRYVTKYLSKAPHRFAYNYRHHNTRNWITRKRAPNTLEQARRLTPWYFVLRHLDPLVDALRAYALNVIRKGSLVVLITDVQLAEPHWRRVIEPDIVDRPWNLPP